MLLNKLNRVARYTLPQTPFNMKQSDSEKVQSVLVEVPVNFRFLCVE